MSEINSPRSRSATSVESNTLNPQLFTSWNASSEKISTELIIEKLGSPPAGYVTVEILHVPMHGSFWLASHPDRIHPRADEFLSDGGFTFGNGGVARVVATNNPSINVSVGDIVAVFGHVPCDHYDCYACNVLHRYTECDYGEGKIMGHGKGAGQGTYAQYCHLSPHSFEVCYKSKDIVSEDVLKALMYAFLVADVRNALTRHPDTLRNRRMLIFGAGMSGHLAAYIHSRTCPESQIVVVDPSSERLESVKEVSPNSISTVQLPEEVMIILSDGQNRGVINSRVYEAIAGIQAEMRSRFKGRSCDLLFDCSSGNSTPLWDNADILSSGCHAIPFGFGSKNILLDKSLIQVSGLNLLMSRGVGNVRNRRETIELIKAGLSKIIGRTLIQKSIELNSFDEAIAYIKRQQEPVVPLHKIAPAFISLTNRNSPSPATGDANQQATTALNRSLKNTHIIENVRITSIALGDPPLLNAAGLHAPWALRIVVQLYGRGGKVGLAELPGSAKTLEALEAVKSTVIGRDARQIKPLLAEIDTVLGKEADQRGGQSWDSRVRVHVHSAFDVACLDLTAREYETRVCDLIGGPTRNSIPFAGYLFYKFKGSGGQHSGDPKNLTGWLAAREREALTPDDIVSQAASMIGEFGFKSLKLKAGILEPELEVDSILALHEHFGPAVPLRIDPNAVWSIPTALKMATRLKGCIEYYEDPVRGQIAMAEVRRATGIPLATNMATTSFDDLPESIRLSSEDIILSDHHFWGGLRPSIELAMHCKTIKRGFSMHSNSHAGVSLAAMVHLASCVPNLDYALDTHYPWQTDEIIKGGKIPIVDGQLPIPDGPGLGVEIDENALAAAAKNYQDCGLVNRDDQVELQKHR